VTFGDSLTLFGLALAVLLYQGQRARERGRDLDAAVGLLKAVRAGMTPWGDLYFGDGYDECRIEKHATRDYQAVMDKGYSQVFHVPTEPLAALIASPAAGGLVNTNTVTAANVALWQIGVFNQFVRQQTDFNARHLAEFKDEDLPTARRENLATAAYLISKMLHGSGIGDAKWYANLMGELEANVTELQDHRARRWWTRPALLLAIVFVAAALVPVTWTGIDLARHDDSKRLPPATTTSSS
jgi:hypothetical protein